MNYPRTAGLALAAVMCLAGAASAAPPVTISGPVTIGEYALGSDTTAAVTFSGSQLGSATRSDLSIPDTFVYQPSLFGVFPVYPFGLDLTGNFNVATAGTYTFGLNSDDGSFLFIGGTQVVSDGGSQGANQPFPGTPQKTGSITLSAGLHPFEVKYAEDTSPPGSLNVFLPTAPPVPEPASYAAFGLGGFGLLGLMLRARKTSRVAAL